MTNFKFQMTSACRKWALALFSCFLVFLFSFTLTHAQTTPEFFMTWRSGAYVESGYQGKILPVPGAPVTVAFELIDGGKLADLSKSTIRWIKNGALVRSGVGLKTATIPTNALTDRDTVRIKVVISTYKDADLDYNFALPLASPEVVIRAPYPQRLIPTGAHTIRALFYNWNTARAGTLIADWSLQDEHLTTTGERSAITLNLPPNAANRPLYLSISAKNTADNLELAETSQTLTIITQP